MLAHFKNNIFPSEDGNEEPLYANLFEITFSFPEILGLTEDDAQVMMLNSKNITLPLTPELGTVTQSFKYAGRVYLLQPTPEQTTIQNMGIDFNINVDNQNSIRTWNYLKKWYDLGWNSQTGELHYKRQMVGQIVAHIHDRQGVVLRRVEFRNVQLLGIGEQKYDWSTNDIINGSATFCADYWVDQYFDISAE